VYFYISKLKFWLLRKYFPAVLDSTATAPSSETTPPEGGGEGRCGSSSTSTSSASFDAGPLRNDSSNNEQAYNGMKMNPPGEVESVSVSVDSATSVTV
jgi:hypothetical protein